MSVPLLGTRASAHDLRQTQGSDVGLRLRSGQIHSSKPASDSMINVVLSFFMRATGYLGLGTSPSSLESLHPKEKRLSNDLDTRTDAATDADRLPKIAESIANGELPIPVDWPEDRLLPLLDLVHAARRRRLVRYFARMIAGDICRENRQED